MDLLRFLGGPTVGDIDTVGQMRTADVKFLLKTGQSMGDFRDAVILDDDTKFISTDAIRLPRGKGFSDTSCDHIDGLIAHMMTDLIVYHFQIVDIE